MGCGTRFSNRVTIPRLTHDTRLCQFDVKMISGFQVNKLHQKVNSYWDMNNLRDNFINRAEPSNPVIDT